MGLAASCGRVLRCSVVAGAVLLACGCSDSAKTTDADAGAPPAGLTPEQAARVVARVGDQNITLGDYAAALERMDPYDRLRYQTPERRRELLKELVDLELLSMEAKRRGLDKKPVAQEAIRQILRDALLDEAHKALPTPTEIPVAEVRAFYDANIDDFREPERRRISAIIMSDEAKAKDVLAKLVADSSANSWGTVFFENSENAQEEKKKRGPLDLAGELGMVGAPSDPKGGNDKVPEPVRVAAYRIEKTGDILPELVPANDKFYIIRMSGRVPPHERTFAEAENQIRQLLLKQRLKELDTNLEAELRKKYKVEIDENALAQVSTAAATPESPPPTPAPKPTTSATATATASATTSASAAAPASASPSTSAAAPSAKQSAAPSAKRP